MAKQKIEDEIVDSLYEMGNAHRVEDISTFVRYTEGGKLIIDLDDLNALNVFNEDRAILRVLNAIKLGTQTN